MDCAKLEKTLMVRIARQTGKRIFRQNQTALSLMTLKSTRGRSER